MTEVEFYLSAMRALWGEVRPQMRSVSGSLTGRIITLRFVIDGPISDDLKDDLYSIGAEVIADASDGWLINEEFLQLDAPADLRTHRLPLLVYQRHETTPPE